MTDVANADMTNHGVVLHASGSAPHVRYEAMEPDVAADGQVSCSLLAGVIQPLDRQAVAGTYPGLGALPVRLGSSGVARIAADAGDVAAGTAVAVLGGLAGLGMRAPGLFAQRFCAPADILVPLPAGADPVAVAASGSSVVTALHALTELADVQAGETVLVLGASGSVGRAAGQLAQLLGATVLSASRQGTPGPAGTPITLDEHLVGSVRAATNGAGVNVIIDCVGGSWLAKAILAGAPACRHVCVGYAAGMDVALSVGLLLLNEHRLIGCNIAAVAPERQRAHWARAMALITEGAIGPEPVRVRPLAQGPAALTEPSAGGRVVLVPGD